eukprot:scaffold59847_cov62-Phaeocystis_antarctica.AAC.2
MAIERLSWLDVLWLGVYCDEESDGGELVAAATGSTSKTKSKLVTSQPSVSSNKAKFTDDLLQQTLPRAEHAAILELLQGELEASEAAGTETAARVAVQETKEL